MKILINEPYSIDFCHIRDSHFVSTVASCTGEDKSRHNNISLLCHLLPDAVVMACVMLMLLTSIYHVAWHAEEVTSVHWHKYFFLTPYQRWWTFFIFRHCSRPTVYKQFGFAPKRRVSNCSTNIPFNSSKVPRTWGRWLIFCWRHSHTCLIP